jgi:hypothetical protein
MAATTISVLISRVTETAAVWVRRVRVGSELVERERPGQNPSPMSSKT